VPVCECQVQRRRADSELAPQAQGCRKLQGQLRERHSLEAAAAATRERAQAPPASSPQEDVSKPQTFPGRHCSCGMHAGVSGMQLLPSGAGCVNERV
jgi:hypothetical protein